MRARATEKNRGRRQLQRAGNGAFSHKGDRVVVTAGYLRRPAFRLLFPGAAFRDAGARPRAFILPAFDDTREADDLPRRVAPLPFLAAGAALRTPPFLAFARPTTPDFLRAAPFCARALGEEPV